MRHFLAVPILVIGVTAAVWAKDLVIGQVQYLGNNAQDGIQFVIGG